VRGAEHALEAVLVLGRTLFQQGEDAAAVVVVDDERQVRSLFAWSDEQAVEVVQQGQVADQRVGRPVAGQGHAHGGRHVAVDACDPAVGEHGDVRAGFRHQVDVPHGVRRAEEQGRAGGQRADDLGRQLQPGRPLLLAEQLLDRVGGTRVRVPPGRQPLGVHTVHMRHVLQVEPPADVRGDVLRVGPLWMVADAVHRRPSHQATHSARQRRPADHDDGFRPEALRQLPGGEQQRTAPEHTRPARERGRLPGRLGDGGPPGDGGDGGRGTGPVLPPAAEDHQRPRGQREVDAAARHRHRRGGRGPPQPAGTPVERFRPPRLEGGHEWLPERDVDLHRPAGLGLRHRPAHQATPDLVLPLTPLGDGELHGHRGRAEQPPLVDGLVGAGAVQLGWPVGGDHEQPDAGVVGFEHRGVEVGGGGPGGAGDGGRPAAGLGQPQGEEPGRSLVDAHVHGEAPVGGGLVQRHGEGGVA
jgi:hypothetical protein